MSEAQKTVRLEFEDNTLLTLICGQHNQHLARIEQALNVSMDSFGNQIKITGLSDKVELASKTFTSLYKQLSAQDNKDALSATLVDDILRQTENGVNPATTPIDKSLFATTWKKKIFPRTAGQAGYFKLLHNNEVVFGLGPAGTGKTYMAVAWAVDFLKRRQVERIILSRPAVEAGERLGFLPGDMKEKVDPYLRPLYDSLYDLFDFEKIQRMIEIGDIEIAPLAFMRGRTLKNSFAILDEAQNATDTQIKMFLTRIGENSKIVVNGDPSQIDLPNKNTSGLVRSKELLGHLNEIAVVDFDHSDVVRHPLVSKIVKAYSKND